MEKPEFNIPICKTVSANYRASVVMTLFKHWLNDKNKRRKVAKVVDTKGNVIKNHYWVACTSKQLSSHIDRVNMSVKRMRKRLLDMRVLLKINLAKSRHKFGVEMNPDPRDQTSWYSLNYPAIKKFNKPMPKKEGATAK